VHFEYIGATMTQLANYACGDRCFEYHYSITPRRKAELHSSTVSFRSI